MGTAAKAFEEAIRDGELTELELKELIVEDARLLGMTYEQAIKAARDGELPRNHVGADIELLVEMLRA